MQRRLGEGNVLLLILTVVERTTEDMMTVFAPAMDERRLAGLPDDASALTTTVRAAVFQELRSLHEG